MDQHTERSETNAITLDPSPSAFDVDRIVLASGWIYKAQDIYVLDISEALEESETESMQLEDGLSSPIEVRKVSIFETQSAKWLTEKDNGCT